MPANGQGSGELLPSTAPGPAAQGATNRQPNDRRGCAEAPVALDRRAIAERLSTALGAPVEVVSHQAPVQNRVSGLAVCPGKVLSYVIDGQARSLRTRNLLELTRRSREAA